MPPTQPPNIDALPHELATFIVHGQLASTVDDDLAAQAESLFVEVLAEELIGAADNARARLEELLPDLADRMGFTLQVQPVIIELEPHGMIEAQRQRLAER